MKRVLYIFYFLFFSFVPDALCEVANRAELLARKELVSPGEEFFLALKISVERGGHVYWKNAGDSGEPISLKLDLPEGFQEIGRYWQTPQKFTLGTLTEYGYSDRAYLLVKIKAPDNLKKGEIIEISGQVTWLACYRECVPLEQNVGLLMVVGSSQESKENEEVVDVLENLPSALPAAEFFETADSLILSVPLPDSDMPEQAYFFVDTPKKLTYSAKQEMKIKDGRAFIFMKKAPADFYETSDVLTGVLAFYNVQGERIRAFDISAQKQQKDLPVFDTPIDFVDFIIALVFAFLGGVLLNLMPCVFPVLSLKAFRLINTKESLDPSGRKKAGLYYMAGVLFSFILIGSVLVLLRSAGAELGWGFQLQYPPFVLAMCLLLFFLGLVFSDVVSVGERLSATGMNIGKDWGDFGTGVLAVVVATPCAAPFMGTALGYGLMNPPAVTMSVFLVMGLGMSFPFLMLDFYPELGKFLPKPGEWTNLLRQFLAFPLYGASAWLLWVLCAQQGGSALASGLICLIVISFSAWLSGLASRLNKLKKTAFASVLLTFVLIGYGIYSVSETVSDKGNESRIDWIPYNAVEIQDFRQAGVPVFIKFSAKWCLTCLVNEKTALSSQKVARAFRQKGVVAFSGDWTNHDDEITAALESFGRAGVPLYVYYAPYARQAVVLPQIITEKTVLSLIEDL